MAKAQDRDSILRREQNPLLARFAKFRIHDQRGALLNYLHEAHENYVKNQNHFDFTDHTFDLGKLDFLAIAGGKPVQMYQARNIGMYARANDGCGVAISARGFFYQDTGPNNIMFVLATDPVCKRLVRLIERGAFDLLCSKRSVPEGQAPIPK